MRAERTRWTSAIDDAAHLRCSGVAKKAADLAFRRAMLGEAAGFGFVHPNKAFVLYEDVRSAAVHGEEIPDVPWDIVKSFAWDVREAINQAVDYASEHAIKKRGKLLKALDEHPDKPKLLEWLRVNGGDIWSDYLAHQDPATFFAWIPQEIAGLESQGSPNWNPILITPTSGSDLPKELDVDEAEEWSYLAGPDLFAHGFAHGRQVSMHFGAGVAKGKVRLTRSAYSIVARSRDPNVSA